MTRRSTFSALAVLALGAAAPGLLQAQALVPKQLAGPPEEFAAMAAPAPAATAILSRSALLPLEDAGDGRRQLALPAERGRLRFVLLGQQDGLELVDPAGAARPARAAASRVQASRLGEGALARDGQEFVLDAARAGSWTLRLPAGSAPAYVLAEGDDARRLASWRTGEAYAGGQVGVTALMDDGAAAVAATPRARQAGASRVASAQLRVTAPDGTVSQWPMYDDGRHEDGAAGDGQYGGGFAAPQPGTYLAQVIVRGTAGGTGFVRTAEHVVAVVERSARLGTAATVAADTADGRLALGLPVALGARPAAHYRVYAEVWGTGRDGSPVAVAWVGGMVAPRTGTLPLGLDPRWIARAGAQAPFELRNVRIEDPDAFVVLDRSASLPLVVPASRVLQAALRTGTGSAVAIDQSMRMGVRPVQAQATVAASAAGTGTHLLLVHGYCSAGVWPAAQFTNASSFLDANQSRSNDQFAQLLASFGSQWNSFGTVAHSQGGMAALHLYTYYWSGLDNATGARLMQSVGTPYQGTNLAGILATVGSWFGVGCGSNTDLTYDGASRWLAGIPTWARAKVNYYTTSFATTKWYINDYCNIASDLVLDDPEDGTTEKAYGQLPGAVNRGHTTGQCHTTGMRDPAQYLDASRNAVMNSNAAR